MKFLFDSAEATHNFAFSLASYLRAGDLLSLNGPLGAGKTTFTRGLGEGLGVRGPVSSPTFVLARTHPSIVGAAPLVHVDAYRLQSAVDLDDLDIDFSGSVVVVEWGDGMLDGVSDSFLELRFSRFVGGQDALPEFTGQESSVAEQPGISGQPVIDEQPGISGQPVLNTASSRANLGDRTEHMKADGSANFADVSLDEAAELGLDESRLLSIVAHGPRWQNVDFSALPNRFE